MKVAINGFGRIGKQFLLAAISQKVQWDFIINEPADLNTIIYSLKHDSVYGSPEEPISVKNNHLLIGNKKIRVIHELNPEKLPWKKEAITLVIDCSGRFTDAKEAKKHISSGAKKVLISAPSKNCNATIIPGVNLNSLKNNDLIVSAGSCTTNCLAPMIKLINDSLGIKKALFTTTHAYTSSQHLIDSHDKKDLVRGRAAAVNIIPTTSGAAISVIEAIPELKNKLDGFALRVPVVDGSISSVFVHVQKKTSLKEINKIFKDASLKKYKGIIQYSSEPLVSTDIIGNTNSCILDSSLTKVIDDFITLSGWYDNELGYAHRLVDIAKHMLKI